VTPQKTSGSDGLDPFFFKVAAPIIATPISDLYNLSLLSREVPNAWKTATVRQDDPNFYRPIVTTSDEVGPSPCSGGIRRSTSPAF
jgi:hypothetical protein